MLIATKRKSEYTITADQALDGVSTAGKSYSVSKTELRLNEDGCAFLLLVWNRILEAFGMKEETSPFAFEHAMQLGHISLQEDCATVPKGKQDLAPEEWERIRSFFRSKATNNLATIKS